MWSFWPGEPVFWWKRITRVVEYPYRAKVLIVRAKRITITVEDPDGNPKSFIRQVAAKSLQPAAVYHEKAADQGPAILEPSKTWGRFTRYVEIGEDLRPVRQVDVFENGHMLSFDRAHWVDDFGILGDAQINRNRKKGRWGQSQEINADKFEQVWAAARASPIWKQQAASAQMGQMGAVPIWLTIRGWRPDPTK